MKWFSGSSVVMRHWIASRGVSILSCGGRSIGGLVQLVALGDENLALDDVDPGDNFRHRVLDLDARIDLDEEKFVGVRDRRRNSTVPALR